MGSSEYSKHLFRSHLHRKVHAWSFVLHKFSRARACLMFHPFSRDCPWIVIGRTGVISRPRGAHAPVDTVACGSLRAVDIVHCSDQHAGLDGPITNPAMKSYTGRTMAAEGTPLALCYGGEGVIIYHGEHGFAHTVSLRKTTDMPYMSILSLRFSPI